MKPQHTVEHDILNELTKRRRKVVLKRNKVSERCSHWDGRINKINEGITNIDQKILKLGKMKLSDEMRSTFQARYIMEKSQLNKKLQNAEELKNNWMVKQHYIDGKVKEAHDQLDDYLRDNDVELLPCGSGECVSSENDTFI